MSVNGFLWRKQMGFWHLKDQINIFIPNTVTIWIPEKSGIQMVDLCPLSNGPVFKWSAKARNFINWKPDTLTANMQVLGIQMVTVY